MKTRILNNGIKISLMALAISIGAKSYAQDNSGQTMISGLVGSNIDSTEKVIYDLFPEYSVAEFDSAQIMRYDRKMELWVFLNDGSIKKVEYTTEQYLDLKNGINEKGYMERE